MERNKSKLAEVEEDKNADDSEKTDNNQDNKEQKANTGLSLKLIQRSTWAPGDGCSLNLPPELLFDDDAEDDECAGEVDANNRDSLIGLEAALAAAKNRANKSKPTIPGSGSSKSNEDPIINNLELSGVKWVDKFFK